MSLSFAPRHGGSNPGARLHSTHTASSAALLHSYTGGVGVGGGVGLSSLPALSRQMAGAESAKGRGMGAPIAGDAAPSPGVRFDLQLGRARDEAGGGGGVGAAGPVPPLRHSYSESLGVGVGSHSARARSLAASAAARKQQAAALGASSAQWRFLKEGHALAEADQAGELLPLSSGGGGAAPAVAVPLTAAGRAYLLAYEQSQQRLATPADRAPFRELLRQQEEAEASAAREAALRAEHDAWQREHGRIPFGEFVALRDRLKLDEEMMVAWQIEQHQQQQEQQRAASSSSSASASSAAATSAAASGGTGGTAVAASSFSPTLSHRSGTSSPRGLAPPSAPAAASAFASASLRANFIPAALAGHVNAPSAQQQQQQSRALFLAQLQRVEQQEEKQQHPHSAIPASPEASLGAADPALRPHPPSQPKAHAHSSLSSGSARPRGGGSGHSVDFAMDVPASTVVASDRGGGSGNGSRSSGAAQGAGGEEEADSDPLVGRRDLEAAQAAAEAIVAATAASTEPAQQQDDNATTAPDVAVVALEDSAAPSLSKKPSFRRAGTTTSLERARSRFSAVRSPSSTSHSGVASGSGSGSGSDASSRDASPVILWRQTNRVTEAVDIPAELRSVFLAEPPASSSAAMFGGGAEGEGCDGEGGAADPYASTVPATGWRTKPTALYRPRALTTLERVALASGADSGAPALSPALEALAANLDPQAQAQRGRHVHGAHAHAHAHGHGHVQPRARQAHAPLPPPESSFTPRVRPPRRALKYGAWYLPTSLWIAEEKHAGSSSSSSSAAAAAAAAASSSAAGGGGGSKSGISARASVGAPHMSLGLTHAPGKSTHGRDVLDPGQAEYEHLRRSSAAGRSGALLGWKEMQQASAGHALRGGVALGSATARAALAGRSLMDDSSADESDDIDAAGKVNAIKARSLEARNRRRRTQDRAKAELYERRRAQKISRRDKHGHGHGPGHGPGMGRAGAAGFGKGGARGRRGGGGGGGSSGEEEEAESPGRNPNPPLASSRFASGTSASTSTGAATATATGTGGSGGGGGGGGGGESLEEKVAALKDQIPHLHIAQEYRLYLERQGGRVPHFLRGVDLNDPEFVQRQREQVRAQGVHDEHPQHPGMTLLAVAKFAAAAVSAHAHSAAGAAAAPPAAHQPTHPSFAGGSHSSRARGSAAPNGASASSRSQRPRVDFAGLGAHSVHSAR